jgi:RecA/RadA recombinase
MTDKKETQEISEENDLFSEFNSFLKKRGDVEEEDYDVEMIPSGIRLLDTILGGGFPTGALSIIVGQPGSGKSMLAMQTLGNAQRVYGGKLIGAFLDSEESTTSVRLAQLGVTNPQIKPIHELTVEKVFKFLEGLSLFKKEKNIIDTPSVVIWDSVANTLSNAEMETEDPNSVIGYKARLLSLLVPKFVKKCSAAKICWIAVNQLRDNIQMGPFPTAKDFKFMSQNKKMPGGNILKFNAFHLIEIRVAKAVDRSKYSFDGIEVTLRCVKNKAFSPNIDITLVGSFTSGFSDFWTSYAFLAETKRMNTGAWNYLVSCPDIKFRTKDAESKYKENEEFREHFDKAVDEALQTEILDKYKPEAVLEKIQNS